MLKHGVVSLGEVLFVLLAIATLVAVFAAAGCVETPRRDSAAPPRTFNRPPESAECEAFDWIERGHRCRVLWCFRRSTGGGGPTTLWCDEAWREVSP